MQRRNSIFPWLAAAGCHCSSGIIIFQHPALLPRLVTTQTLLASPLLSGQQWTTNEKDLKRISTQSVRLARRNVLKGLKPVQFSYLWHFCCAVLTLSSSVGWKTFRNKSLQTSRTNIVMAAAVQVTFRLSTSLQVTKRSHFISNKLCLLYSAEKIS